MKITLRPRSSMGMWTVGLIVAFGVCSSIFGAFVALGERGGEAIFSNLKLAIPYLLAAAFGIGALFAGLLAIVRSKDRSLLVLAATALGLLVLLWVGAEIVFPH